MVSRGLLVMAIIGALLGPACGGGTNKASGGSPSPSPTPPPPSPSASGPTCSPSGTELEISSSPSSLAFDKTCLAAPAGAGFTIRFDNRSPSVPHDVAIASEGLVDVFFEGEVVTGPKTVTYHVEALDAGMYTFYCKVHPTAMNGTFVVA